MIIKTLSMLNFMQVQLSMKNKQMGLLKKTGQSCEVTLKQKARFLSISLEILLNLFQDIFINFDFY
jgi:hypothetical protein